MSEDKLVETWLLRAKSNLERAKAGRISEGILYDDLCFDCQQAVEKSLKAFLIYKKVEFPRTHSISKLLELVEQSGIYVPDEIKDSVILTDCAVETRYPGDCIPADEEMYKYALNLAEKVVSGLKNSGRLKNDKGISFHRYSS